MIDMTANEAIEQLVRVGILSRWWCDVCQDYVPYRTLEMTEGKSRRLHGSRHRRVRISVPYPSMRGPGKTHILTKESQYTYTSCGRTVHAQQRAGRLDEVTCKFCNPR